MSDQGKTRLTPQQEALYKTWLAKEEAQRGHPIESDDYDMRGFWAEHGGAVTTKPEFVMKGTNGEAHFNDAHKLPNHPTFSEEALRAKQRSGGGPAGGHWAQNEKGEYDRFIPSPDMLSDGVPEHKAAALKKYFNFAEPDIRLQMPPVDEYNTEKARDLADAYSKSRGKQKAKA